ncbi:hypothetical protein BDEG_22402 [Batrachochytrium dendrobatidis JEL423]|uniref:Uncharacterized protein n=1 Tax=Batrachochytrium dendrobatidis (strain JEL423) TaxID=403673 RepID=A0A177WEM2_BATDL|nr:hypothetical protein BDEG_22402 [Batrachochytrium dendrobatidis JEL423]
MHESRLYMTPSISFMMTNLQPTNVNLLVQTPSQASKRALNVVVGVAETTKNPDHTPKCVSRVTRHSHALCRSLQSDVINRITNSITTYGCSKWHNSAKSGYCSSDYRNIAK